MGSDVSYLVLARKWRPKSFSELVGQEHVQRALANALDHDRLHHAYLFTGTRGVGKTTIARIFTKCLNCETGISSQPCGVCSTCREVDEGRFVDLLEIDAASRTRVEDTREILENVQYAPTRGRYKVYLIDEVHMLSRHSFNALLKTLEEPPPHVKFLLATTDPQQLPVTILSRCLQFALKAMAPERIVTHLQHVLSQEMVPVEEAALWELARAADGSMRDALSLTDQAISFGAGRLNADDVAQMLGLVDRRQVVTLLQALSTHDVGSVRIALQAVAASGADYQRLLASLISLLHQVTLAQMLPDLAGSGEWPAESVQQLANALTAEETQLMYQIALHGRRDLPLAPDAYAGVEMCLLRMLAFRPQSGGASPAPASGGGSAGAGAAAVTRPAMPAAGAAATGASTAGVASVRAVASASVSALATASVAVATTPAPTAMRSVSVPNSAAIPNSAPAQNGAVVSAQVVQLPVQRPEPVLRAPQSLAEQPKSPIQQVETGQVVSAADALLLRWQRLIEQLRLSGAVLNMARHCVLVAESPTQLQLQMASRHKLLASSQQLQQLEQAYVQLQGQSAKVQLAVVDAVGMTPAEADEQARQASRTRALTLFRGEPLVQALEQQMQASIDEASVHWIAEGK